MTGSVAHDREPDPESVARAIALRLLTIAPRSRAQLADAMARREVPDDVASAVLDRFADVGLVDDAEYARMLVRSRHDDRGLARRALGEELRRKGISAELATAALAELDPESERATAQRLVARKLASTRGLDTQVRVRRALAALGRKGYPPGIVMEVVREYLASEQGADEAERLPTTLDEGDDPDAISGP
ncbi:regulatory protein RecX [mine drainage metagenome]|uniref:Regulatory protein RecX n=1 Tax=mine drainage metagenome TaxID=410659 RepID=A0A1J5QZE1_9ZZZZ